MIYDWIPSNQSSPVRSFSR
ncbi:unnamed protein product, partial [Rotaria magnacalcarata]